MQIGIGLSIAGLTQGAPYSAYAANALIPPLIADFINNIYVKDGVASTFDGLLDYTCAGSSTYIDSSGVLQTALANVPRLGNHIYNGSAWVNDGLRIESAAATNLLLNNGTLSTQNVTVTNAAHTLHFTGTGTLTLTGTATDGPLVGAGTGENNRVSLTFTPTAGTLTVTVSGTVTNAQLELGSVPSSVIATAGSTVTRPAQTLEIAAADMPTYTGALSIQMQGSMTYADNAAASQQTFARWYTDASNFITIDMDTDGAATGEINADQNRSGTLDNVVAGAEYSPGINVPFNLASRHGSTFINVAKDGTAATANETPTAIADLSAEDFQIASDLNGNLHQLILWPEDIGDTGIEEATS